MTTENNKKIVEKTKEVLHDLGYEVKTNHIYEMFSRISGFKSWHVAKTKGIEFADQIPDVTSTSSTKESLMEDIFNLVEQTRVKNPIDPKILKLSSKKKVLDLSTYEKSLKNQEFKNVFCYGMNLDSEKLIKINPMLQLGALFCGGMGSGKTLAMKFSIATHILANSENTIYLLCDAFKGLGDYKQFFHLNNVFPVIHDTSKIISVIHWSHNEVMERRKEFARHGSNSLQEYNDLMKKNGNPELPSIILGIEEFDSFILSEALNFYTDTNHVGTPASKFNELMRIGRIYGFTILAAAQKASSEHFPNSLISGFSQLMAFKVNSLKNVTSLGLPQCADIPSGYPGLCVTQDGMIQFPYLDDNVIKSLLDKYHKPLKGKTLTTGLENL